MLSFRTKGVARHIIKSDRFSWENLVAVSHVDALSHIPLFRGLPLEEIEALSRSARRRSLVTGSILFLEGDVGDTAYVVLSGRVDISVASLDGNELTLHRAGPGGYVGELALLDGGPRSATATVAEDAVLLAIGRDDFLNFLRTHSDTAIQLLKLTSQRLRLADEKIKTLSFQDVGGRLARTLIELANDEAVATTQHDELASLIGSRRPTVSTLLSRWRAAGYLETGRGFVRILDRPALEELAEL